METGCEVAISSTISEDVASFARSCVNSLCGPEDGANRVQPVGDSAGQPPNRGFERGKIAAVGYISWTLIEITSR
jgi:hypothetical protein